MRTGSGLARRMLIASCLLSVIVAGTFAVLYMTIISVRDSQRLASHCWNVLASANRLERLVVDLESGERGFIMTGDRHYLRPWNSARAAIPGEAIKLRELANASKPEQGRHATEIANAGESYLRDYSVPLVQTAERDLASARTGARAADGERRLSTIRTRFDRFVASQHKIIVGESTSADTAASRALLVSAGGAAAWLLLILTFAGYLTRVIARPVRSAAMMAHDLAHGDLTVRMPESSPAEIGVLERAFNTMARTLQANRAAVHQNAEEQQALRRVATLVARGVAPEEVFNAVSAEVSHLMGVAYAGTIRFEPDNAMTIIGSWGQSGAADPLVPVGTRWSLDGESVSSRVARTGRPTRMRNYGVATSEIGKWSYAHGFRSGVGCPIVVDKRLWGVMIALTMSEDPLPEGTEERLLAFTELIGTAIANAETREELRASRTRVVTTSDETRRRIERNLHDSTQQHLLSLGLELRAIEEKVDDPHARKRLEDSSRRLTEIVEDLQEISRGLHPAILSRAGLGPALKALRRRAGVPMDLDLNLPGRLPEQVEVAVYYTVSEAVTNATKHAEATGVQIQVNVRDGRAWLCVRDDGVGGADYGDGTGLIGIRDRVEALGGRIRLTSPAGKGTSIEAEIPIKR
jgi:signal transduction histidine kinase